MHCRSLALAAALLACATGPLAGTAAEQPAAARAETLRQYSLDPSSSLDSRVADAPDDVLHRFAEAGLGTPARHVPTVAERRKLSEAFAALPPLHRRILQERLRRISFLDGMPNTGLTSAVNPAGPYRLYDITLRAGVFDEDASTLVTGKERVCFDATGSSLSLSIDAGAMDALVYVILHEATHVVDSALQLNRAPLLPGMAVDAAPQSRFAAGVWTDRTVLAAKYRDPLLLHTAYRTPGTTIPIDRAADVYRALGKTPFASLYGSSNWYDDLAELAAWYHWTERLHQPYRIAIRDAGREVFSYEPMASELVRARFGEVARFYADE